MRAVTHRASVSTLHATVSSVKLAVVTTVCKVDLNKQVSLAENRKAASVISKFA